MTSREKRRQWTEEQLSAIKTRGVNLLVSAAAGAGKTAVLVERVIRRLLDKEDLASLDNMLVVTFTEAAAAEMRQRIGAALEEAVTREPENENLRRELMLLNHAHISTIHSFCLWVLRTYFYRLNLDPGFRVIDPFEADLLQLEVMEEVLEECFTGEPEGGPFTDLADSLGGRGDANLIDLVLKVWNFTRSLPWPEAWLEEAVAVYQTAHDRPVEAQPWYFDLREAVKLRLQEAACYLEEAKNLAAAPGGPEPYLENLEGEKEQLDKILKKLEEMDWADLNTTLGAVNFSKLKAVRGDCDKSLKEEVSRLRNKAKNVIRGLQEEFCREEAVVKEELERTGKMVAALVELVRRFDGAYTKLKKCRALADFSDLEHLCLEVLLDENAKPGELRPSAVALELRRQFEEILVDEYQDINTIQDAILNLIARRDPPNLFMVGDVKQSIYRFRMANPELFLDKYHNYPEREGGNCRRIRLATNFRSRSNIINAVNFIFSQVFSSLVGELVYDGEAALVAGAEYPENPGVEDPPVEVYLLERQWEEEDNTILPGAAEAAGENTGLSSREELTALEEEALLVARRIRKLVQGTLEKPGPECQVWDSEKGEYRDITYRDIVVLLRAARDRAPVYLDKLKQYGIPSYADLTGGYFAAVEVETVLSLLRVIDNPRQDIPLAAVLRSPVVGLSAGELTRIRLADPGKDFYDALQAAAFRTGTQGHDLISRELADRLRKFLNRLEDWRTLARRSPLDDVIWQLYRETGYYEFVGGLPGGTQRQANLRALLDRARQFENFVHRGLFRFLRFIDRLRQNEGDLDSARALGENENVVRIMSIHKAKGLEFPVVIVADMGKAFNIRDLHGDVLLHGKNGLGALYIDTASGIKYPTLPYLATAHRLHMEALSEEIRILYVAMTRAREKLILTGSASGLTSKSKKWLTGLKSYGEKLEPIFVARGKTPLDWICPALSRHSHGNVLREMAGKNDVLLLDSPSSWWIRIVKKSALEDNEIPDNGRPYSVFLSGTAEKEILDGGPVPEKQAVIDCTGTSSEALQQEVAARLSWTYPRLQLSSLPVKLAVTDLKRRFNPFSDEVMPLRPDYSGITRRPLFIQGQQGLTAAERGTATHLVLQHVPLEQKFSPAGLNEFLKILVAREVLTPEQVQAVNLETVTAFFSSSLGRRLLAQPDRVRREIPFSLAVPVEELYPWLQREIITGEIILVQGIIDCLLEEEDGYLLLDFKTGKIPADPAASYREQVGFYCRAVKSIFKKPVKEAYLYFLDGGSSYKIECDQL